MREKKKFVCVCKKQDDIGGTGAGRLGETKGLGQRENDKNLEGEGPGTLLVIDVGNELDRDGVEYLPATRSPDAFLPLTQFCAFLLITRASSSVLAIASP